MHVSLLPTSTPPTSGPEQAVLEQNLAWLRAELEGARLLDQKAAIRHELGVLEELAGRDTIAVRELLAAVNALPRFKEPLERLIVLIERHRSFKNLPTLLEHLCRSADSAEELARAELARAWCALNHTVDESRALLSIEAALGAAPQDPAALLTLEILARRRGDAALLRRALEGRVKAAQDPSYANCLRLDLADAASATGDFAFALAALEQASADTGDIGLRALERRIALGRKEQRVDWILPALELHTERLIATLPEPVRGPSEPEPSAARRARAVAGLVELARLQAALGHDRAALDRLERAGALAPNDPVVTYACLLAAERVGRHDLVERIAQAEIEALPAGSERAALGVLLAESRLGRNEPAAALGALDAALDADPECWVARAFQLDLLRGTRDARGHAQALERTAEHLRDARASRRYYLLAAADFSRQADDPAVARRMLAAAEARGTSPELSDRLARALAHAGKDAAWYSSATRRLLEREENSTERTSLALELWRTALLEGDAAEQRRAEDVLELLPEGRTAARLARAYAPLARAVTAPDPAALLALAEQATDPTSSAALGWTAALGALYSGSESTARDLLVRQHAADPSRATLGGTLVGVLERAPEQAALLGQVLRATAGASDDAALAASLLIEAGLRSFRSAQGAAAATDFDDAERRLPGSGAALGEWARRASTKGLAAPEGREADVLERLLAALERGGLANPPSLKQLRELEAALGAVSAEQAAGSVPSPSPITTAARLFVLLLGRCLGVSGDPAILEQLAAESADGSRLVDAWRYLECMAQPDPAPISLEEVTRKWSESSASLASSLEWLGATERLGQTERECAARYRLSELLGGPAAELCAASAALVEHFAGGEPAGFLTGETPQLRLTNLETSPPGCDPRRRARALEDAAPLLGADAEPLMNLLRGYNLLAAGDTAAARSAFESYTRAFPDDVAGWEALTAAARQLGDDVLLAEVTLQLAATTRHPAQAARSFEVAATLYFERLSDPVRGEKALTRAVDSDISRSSSFGTLLRRVRESGDTERLLELCRRRLEIPVSRAELLDLEWERARAFRQLGDTSAALASLDRVLLLDSEHIGALALFGEIYITLHRYSEAADVLSRLAALEAAPRAERLTSGLCAVDLFENQLDATDRALEVLLLLNRAGLSTLPVRERLARAAAKRESWDDAVVVLEQLMFERGTEEERAEAARLALVIHRDRRHDPRSAGHAVEALLAIHPDDAEGLDLLLSGALDPLLVEKLLTSGQEVVGQRLAREPFQLDALKRLARIADQTGSASVRQVALGALIALGHGPSSGARAELAALDQQLCSVPSIAFTDDLLLELRDPEDSGPIPELIGLVSTQLGRSFGPELAAFQVSRRDRIAPGAGPARDEVDAWVAAFGLGEFELYQSSLAAERAVVLATEPLSIVLGARAGTVLEPFQRQALVRCLYAQRRQLGVLTQIDEIDVGALIVALCKLGGVSIEAPNYARQADYERQLNRVLPRKTRKLLPAAAQAVRDSGTHVPTWVRAALASLDRAAALAVGDLSVVLAEGPPSERQGESLAPPTDRTRRLASFLLAPSFELLRQRFGVSRV